MSSQFDVQSFRKQFPQLQTKVGGQDLVYLDSAATSLKPRRVADRLHSYYLNEVANIHRGAHFLSRQGTENYEAVRLQTKKMINGSNGEVVFTRGVTEAMNLLAYSFGFEHLGLGDVILLTPYEHHSNIIPWKILSENTGCQIELLEFDRSGNITEAALNRAFSKNVKLVSMMLYSNVTGVRLNVEPVLQKARAIGALTVIDAAQAMLHEKIDVQKLDCDFLTFSAHKMFGPFGVGVLFGKSEILNDLPPFQGGGSMISSLSWSKSVYQDAPHKFEAGTPNIADVIAFGEALSMLEEASLEAWAQHGKKLGLSVEKALQANSRVQLMGPTYAESRKTDIISFSYEGAHPSDVGEMLDQMGIAVRAGHLCAQPLMESMGVQGTVRVSLAPYNDENDVEKFVNAMEKIKGIL
jgi:cysteine desulfurase / selenocysteine lyase